jgi:hypothetical protein
MPSSGALSLSAVQQRAWAPAPLPTTSTQLLRYYKWSLVQKRNATSAWSAATEQHARQHHCRQGRAWHVASPAGRIQEACQACSIAKACCAQQRLYKMAAAAGALCMLSCTPVQCPTHNSVAAAGGVGRSGVCRLPRSMARAAGHNHGAPHQQREEQQLAATHAQLAEESALTSNACEGPYCAAGLAAPCCASPSATARSTLVIQQLAAAMAHYTVAQYHARATPCCAILVRLLWASLLLCSVLRRTNRACMEAW